VILFPNCKINLGLQLLRKREDGFHDLETIFYPLPLVDALEIVQASETGEEVILTLSGLPIEVNPHENICINAYRLLKKDFDLPPIKIHLHKHIPIGAGLGGGSADGAFTLILINKKFNLNLSHEQLIAHALQLGSDCPFFIKNKVCYATRRGEVLQEVQLDLSPYKIALVNPGILINTGWAFSQIQPKGNRTPVLEIIQQSIEKWKDNLINDFEPAVFKQYPLIKEIKDKLYSQGAVYASMSGSGSSVYGIFQKNISPVLDLPKNFFIQWFA
jgi:4-diphosphocytidyl-2-C-methyl-D-erythritol kinase